MFSTNSRQNLSERDKGRKDFSAYTMDFSNGVKKVIETIFTAIKKVNMKITNTFTDVGTLILLLKRHQPFSLYLK